MSTEPVFEWMNADGDLQVWVWPEQVTWSGRSAPMHSYISAGFGHDHEGSEASADDMEAFAAALVAAAAILRSAVGGGEQ